MIKFKNILRESIQYQASLNEITYEIINQASRFSERQKLKNGYPKKAYEEGMRVFMSLPDPIPIYRGIPTYIELSLNNPGISWTYDRKTALAWLNTHVFDKNENLYLLSATVNKNNVDWITTFMRYAVFTWSNPVNQKEYEVKLKDNDVSLLENLTAQRYEYDDNYIMNSNQERMFVHQGFDGYLQQVTNAYMKAKSYDAEVVPHWKALIQDDRKLAQRLLSKVKVEWVAGQPYANYEELQKDVKQNHHLAISEDYLEHPVFSREDNLIFRAVHDYYTHVLGNHPFGAKGELEAYNLGLKLYSRQAIPALFTEVVGQASVAVTTGKFPEQKVVLLPGFDYFNVGKLA